MSAFDISSRFDLWIGIGFSTLLYFLGIFNQDVREWIVESYRRLKSRTDASYNARIQERIDLLIDLSSSPSKATASFFAQLFVLAILFAMVFFFAVMYMLKFLGVLSALAFLGHWFWFLIAAVYPFDIAVQLRNPERSVEHLRDRLR